MIVPSIHFLCRH